VTAFATQISDRRLKTNIRPIDQALEKVEQLTGVLFDWDQDKLAGLPHHPRHLYDDTSLIAQDVWAVAPQAVKLSDIRAPQPTAEGDDDGGTPDRLLLVQQERVVPLLVQSIKELSKHVQEMEARLHSLESK
jgi:hypothetical protein